MPSWLNKTGVTGVAIGVRAAIAVAVVVVLVTIVTTVVTTVATVATVAGELLPHFNVVNVAPGPHGGGTFVFVRNDMHVQTKTFGFAIVVTHGVAIGVVVGVARAHVGTTGSHPALFAAHLAPQFNRRPDLMALLLGVTTTSFADGNVPATGLVKVVDAVAGTAAPRLCRVWFGHGGGFGPFGKHGAGLGRGVRVVRVQHRPTRVVDDPAAVQLLATGVDVAASVVLAPHDFTPVDGSVRIIAAQLQACPFLNLGLVITVAQLNDPTVFVSVVVFHAIPRLFGTKARDGHGTVFPHGNPIDVTPGTGTGRTFEVVGNNVHVQAFAFGVAMVVRHRVAIRIVVRLASTQTLAVHPHATLFVGDGTAYIAIVVLATDFALLVRVAAARFAH